MTVHVEGDAVFNARIDRNGHINKQLKGYEKRKVYIVIQPKETLEVL